jgi:hypothetical protein
VLIRDAARTLARHAWLERRLFEVVGGWVAGTADGEVAAVLAATSVHHGWHATLFEERVPLLHDLEPSELEPPAALVRYVDGVAASSGDLERLVAVADVVLPERIARYEALLAGASPVSDAPVARALRLVLTDEQDDRWTAAEVLLPRLREEGDGVRAAAHRSALERLLPTVDA